MATLLEKINSKQATIGTKESPALSCMDIYTCHGDSFKSGKEYYIEATLCYMYITIIYVCIRTYICSYAVHIHHSHTELHYVVYTMSSL